MWVLLALLLIAAPRAARSQVPAILRSGKTAADLARVGTSLGAAGLLAPGGIAKPPPFELWTDEPTRLWTPPPSSVASFQPSIVPALSSSPEAAARMTACETASGILLPLEESVSSAARLVGDPYGRIARLVQEMYPDAADAQVMYSGILSMVRRFDPAQRVGSFEAVRPGEPLFTQRDVFLITYADMIRPAPGQSPLQTLTGVIEKSLPGINTVHILPFFPSTSDGGFAVADYTRVAPQLGTWADIAALRKTRKLMFDAVDNHTSTSHPWFREYLAGNPDYADFYINVDDPLHPALRQFFRPRTTPLTHEFENRNIWTTFGPDQADLNVRNPYVELALLEKDLNYVQHGATEIRKDAIAFLFKVPEERFTAANPPTGRDTIHLRETHASVELERAILDLVAPDVSIVTETNVPHAENVSYFGTEGHREADLVYNFPLPPLLAHTFVSGDTGALVSWLRTLDDLPAHGTLFNFLASHDGIGVGGARGFLSEDDIDRLAEEARRKGGLVGEGVIDGQPRPYELNITWPSLLTETDASLQENAGRLLASYSIQLSLKGVPAIYFPTFLSEPNWTEGAKELTRRDINRRRAELAEVEDVFRVLRSVDPQYTETLGWTRGAIEGLRAKLGEEPTLAQVVFHQLEAMTEMRGGHAPFDPNAPQLIVDADPGVVSILRHSGDGRRAVFSLTNVTGERRTVTYEVDQIRKALAEQGYDNPLRDNAALTDILTGRRATVQDGKLTVELGPFETLWLNAPILLK